MAKRKNGEGSWGTKTINGVKYKYFKKQYEWLDSIKYFYGKTEKEINQKRKKYEEEYSAKKKIVENSSTLTLGEYLRSSLKEMTHLTPNGYDGYEHCINRIENLKEYDIYNKQLAQLNKEICKKFVQALVKHGYARKTITKTTNFVKLCLNQAVEEQIIVDNPMANVKNPKEENVVSKTTVHNFFSKQQMETFCKGAMHIETPDDRHNYSQKIGEYTYGYNGLALAFIGQSGLRVGELTALTIDCIDFDKNIINVYASESLVISRDKNDNAIMYIDDKGISRKKKVRSRKTTKTEAGIRYVPLTPLCKKIVQIMQQEKKKIGCNDKHIFVTTLGTLQTKDRLGRTLKSICKRYDLPELTPHELRHSYGSIILHQEHVDIQVVSKLLGHADITTTYNIYAHVLKEIMAESVKIFE